MRQRHLVSIIINNYNYGRFLRDAIDSALRQTYRGVEIIVVDDGSTDDSPNIILSYGDRIISVLKQNAGQASALNAGFARSHGQLIIFLDSDDALRPEAAQRVCEIFHANPQVAKVQYRMEIIDAQGARTGRIKPFPHQPLRSGNLTRSMLLFPDDVARMSTSGNAFAATVLQRICPIPEEHYRLGPDYYLGNITPLFGPVVFLDSVLADYRVHGTNNFEPFASQLDLAHIRQTIRFSSTTDAYIKKFAGQLGLMGRPNDTHDVLSVSSLGLRLISLKLDPLRHPLQQDTIWRLFVLGVRAALRRFDISWPMKVLFVLWFGAMAAAPTGLARRLAAQFLFPERRGHANKVLGAFHRAC